MGIWGLSNPLRVLSSRVIFCALSVRTVFLLSEVPYMMKSTVEKVTTTLQTIVYCL